MTSQFRIIHEQDYWTYHSKLMKLLIFVSLLSINQDKMLFIHNSFIYCIQDDQNKTSNSSDPANNTFVWFFLIFLKYLLYRRPLSQNLLKDNISNMMIIFFFIQILFYSILYHFISSYYISFILFNLIFLSIFYLFLFSFTFFILFYFILFFFILL